MEFQRRPEETPREGGEQVEPLGEERPALSERAGPADTGREGTLHPDMQLALGLEPWPQETEPESPRAQSEREPEPSGELTADERDAAADLFLVDTAWSELDEAAPAWPPELEQPANPDAIWGTLLDDWEPDPERPAEQWEAEPAAREGDIDVWPWDEQEPEAETDAEHLDAGAASEIAPPEDARELRLLGDEELEEVGRGLLEVLDPEAWARADLPERMRMAQHAHRYIQDAYGLEAAPLLYDMNLPGPVAGRFDPSSGLVSVNPTLLEDDHPGELLDTLAHESRHAVQVALVAELREAAEAGGNEPPRDGVDWDAVERFGEGMARYDANDAEAYHANDVEVDARRAGLQLAGNGYWRAFMERLEG